jgi:hypothetical protein
MQYLHLVWIRDRRGGCSHLPNLASCSPAEQRVVVETNHRDLMCSFIAHGEKASQRLPDGTLFIDEPEFEAISGVARLNWYWSDCNSSGEKHAQWRCYTPMQIVELVERAGLRFSGVYKGLSETPYKADRQAGRRPGCGCGARGVVSSTTRTDGAGSVEES